MNDLTIINKGTAVAVRRDNSPIVSNGRIGKAIAVAANDLIETYRTPNMTPEQTGATMRSYVKVMEGHSEAVVERALNALIVSNPAGRWLPSPVDLRDAIDRIEWAPLYALWQRLTARLNMVAADVREALRAEVFDTLRPLSEELDVFSDDWERFIARVAAGTIYDRDGNLLQADHYAAVLHRVVEERHWAERLAATIDAVAPGIDREFERHREAIELIEKEGRRYLDGGNLPDDKRTRLGFSRKPSGRGAVVAVEAVSILEATWDYIEDLRNGRGYTDDLKLQTGPARFVTAQLPDGILGRLILRSAMKQIGQEDFEHSLNRGDC
jgi:hypothetical protein